MSALEPTRPLDRLDTRPVSELQPHPEAAEVPLLPEPEYEALKADIAANGVQVPIQINSADLVLDGRARLRAIRELDQQQIRVTVHQPADELAHMLRAALHRRQLTASQRAAVAAKLADLEQLQTDAANRRNTNLRHGPERASLPERETNPDGESIQGRVRERIAQLSGTGERTAQDVLTVQQHDPDMLEQVLRGELSASTAASKIRRRLRDQALPPAPPMPHGPFQLILADPPWQFGSPDSQYAPEQHYPCLPTADICALQLPAADDCILFLWACNALLPDAFKVLDAWGSTYKNHLIWDKGNIGPGVWLRQRHELLLIATKGTISPPEPEDRVESLFQAPRGRHSEKPEASYQAIERMYPHLTKLELFRRGTPRPGWHAWGNETQPTHTEPDNTENRA